jgi:hypothetical protein
MVASETGPIFTKCLQLITCEHRNPEKEALLQGVVNFLIANYRRNIKTGPFQEDITFFMVLDQGSLFSVTLADTSFVVQVCQPSGSSIYRVTTKCSPQSHPSIALNECPSDQQFRHQIFTQFTSCPSSAFLLGVTTNCSRRGLKIVAPSKLLAVARLKFRKQLQRVVCTFGMIYIDGSLKSRSDILSMGWADTSTDFRHFATALGDLRGTVRTRDGRPSVRCHLLFWRNLRYWVTWQVAPLIVDATLENGIPSEEIWAQLGEYKVLILWIENGSYDREAFSSERAKVYIIVEPTDNPQCLRITVRKSDAGLKFALIEGSITVSKKIAGLVVRWTAVFANDAIRANDKTTGPKEKVPNRVLFDPFGQNRLFSFGL